MEPFRASTAPHEPKRTALGKEAGRALEFINLYRWILALLLIILYLSGHGGDLLGATRPKLLFAACLAYLGVALIGSAMQVLGAPRQRWRLYAMAAADIVAITVMVFASAGVASGLGMLLILPLIGAGVLLSPRMAGLIAAVATLTILGEEAYRALHEPAITASFTQAGILGALFFITTVTSSLLSQRTRESEALAERQSADLASLAQLNERIIQQIQMGVLVSDPGGRVRMVNSAALELLGRTSVLPGTRLASVSRSLGEAWRRWQRAPYTDPGPIHPDDGDMPILPRFSRLDGDERAPTLILLEDERRVSQRAQNMKLAALGQLSASIAHEIRNPLGAISHAAQLLGESTQLDESARHMLEIIRRHGARINHIIEDVLRLSRRDSAEPEALHLAPWLAARTREFCDTRPEQAVEFKLREVSKAITARVDPGQLQQVLVNLWENAAAHARQAPGSPVVVRLRTTMSQARQRVAIDVIDNGPGIESDVLERVFDPFFTTARQGTGLGLYIARELCEANNGTLTYLRDPYDGGFFRLSFAYAGPPIAAEAAPTKYPLSPVGRGPGRGEETSP